MSNKSENSSSSSDDNSDEDIEYRWKKSNESRKDF